jgi:hypothetical protein
MSVSGKGLPLVSRKMRIHVMLSNLSDSSFLKGTLFSAMQATMQLPHPVHLSRSMTIPNLWFKLFFIKTSLD